VSCPRVIFLSIMGIGFLGTSFGFHHRLTIVKAATNSSREASTSSWRTSVISRSPRVATPTQELPTPKSITIATICRHCKVTDLKSSTVASEFH
jgi:hypothetical protein